MKNRTVKRVIFVFLIFGIFSCFKKGQIKEEIDINKDENTILVASFNALRLGEKQKDYRIFAQILAKFDLIGLEEVMNEKGVKKTQAYLEKLTKEKWDYIISENSVGSENYREYFAFIYRKSRFSEARGIGFYKEKDENEFMREPYGAYFKAGNFDFVYISLHIRFLVIRKSRGYWRRQIMSMFMNIFLN